MNEDLARFWKRVSDSTGVPPEGLSFLYDACGFTQQSRGVEADGLERHLRHFSAAEFCQSFVRLAQEKFGDDYVAALRSYGLDSSTKLGRAVFLLIDRNVMQRRECEAESDFGGQFDFSGETAGGSTEAVYSYPLTGLPDYRYLQRRTPGSWLERVFWVVVFAAWFVGVVPIAIWAAVHLDPLPVPAIVAALLIVSGIIWSRLQYPLRFSLRTLLITTTIVALILGIIVVMSR